MPTPIENQIPPNSESIAVELTTGEKISSERCSRWYNPRVKKYFYQVELEGKQYLGFRTEDGKIELV